MSAARRLLLAGAVSTAVALALHAQGDEPPPTWIEPQETVVTGQPVRLVVPRLHIRARVVGVLSRDQVLSPPADAGTVGWWAQGARPGEQTGTTVLTAHTLHAGGGVFDRLESLAAGDRISVVVPAGRVRYDVRAVRHLDRDELAMKAGRLFRPDGPHRLLLVTCTDWNGEVFLSNVVVVARPVAQVP